MIDQISRPRNILFVDDDDQFLSMLSEMFSPLSKGRWKILTSNNHARALQLLSKERVDLAVLDLQMPVMDGLQFLQLIRRSHPGLLVVIFTGHSDPKAQKSCLEHGAALYLHKLITPDGFAAVFAALNALMDSQPEGEFRGVMRRIGLNEVLQIECLGRKSSILEVFTGQVRGRIFISDGSIIHAESGPLQGEVALYSLLALPGGEFNLAAFVEPQVRSISGQHEFLLMEAARLKDETSATAEGSPSIAQEVPGIPATLSVKLESKPVSWETPQQQTNISEIVLWTRAGGLLFEAGCESVEERLGLLRSLADQAFKLSGLLRIGGFDRLEAQNAAGRVVCQVRPDRLLFVQSSKVQANPK
jgi:CheY-like chemotaxis protein